jgi:ArsR family transcriptional regulator
MNSDRIVAIAKALADPTRLRMLQHIREQGEVTCTCLCDRFPLAQATVSHHIRILTDAGLIRVEKDGLYHRLTIQNRTLADFARALPVRTLGRAGAPPDPGARRRRRPAARPRA